MDDWSDKELEQLDAIREELLQALKAKEGSIWKEAQGELHLQQHEMPNWILLYHDSSAVEAYQTFLEIVKPYRDRLRAFAKPIKITACFAVIGPLWPQDIIPGDKIEQLEGIEILNDIPEIQLKKSRPSVFDSVDSIRS